MDNSSTSDILIEYIAEDLKDERIAYDLQQYQLRCDNDHNINLTVCALIFKNFQKVKVKLMELLSYELVYRLKS